MFIIHVGAAANACLLGLRLVIHRLTVT